MFKANILQMTHEGLSIIREHEGLLVFEQVRESDPMDVAHDVMVHAVDEKECT
jgi:hypothetical protein